jgi:hypothetical protein
MSGPKPEIHLPHAAGDIWMKMTPQQKDSGRTLVVMVNKAEKRVSKGVIIIDATKAMLPQEAEGITKYQAFGDDLQALQTRLAAGPLQQAPEEL